MTPTELPLPPPELVHRVVPAFGVESADDNLQVFHEGGRDSVRMLEAALAAVGRDLGDFERLLDFGCGPGRMLRWLAPLAERMELHGADIDPDAIAWCERHLPFARFVVAPHEPPLQYDAGHFDLVVNHSVFTHLDERYQDLWLGELQRVTRPGAVLLLTVHGVAQAAATFDALAGAGVDPAPYRRRLETDGIVFFEHDTFIGSSHPSFYRSSLHAPWYVFEHWHRFFDVRGYLPLGAITQDLVILGRREDDAPVPPSIAARPGAAHPTATTSPGAGKVAGTRGGSLPSRLRGLAGAPLGAVRLLLRLVDLAAEQGTRAAEDRRRLELLHGAVEQQGERITLLAREIRALAAASEGAAGRTDRDDPDS